MPFSVALNKPNQDFKGTQVFDVEYLRNGARFGLAVTRQSRSTSFIYAWSGYVWMGDRLRKSNLRWRIIRHPGLLSLNHRSVGRRIVPSESRDSKQAHRVIHSPYP